MFRSPVFSSEAEIIYNTILKSSAQVDYFLLTENFRTSEESNLGHSACQADASTTRPPVHAKAGVWVYNMVFVSIPFLLYQMDVYRLLE